MMRRILVDRARAAKGTRRRDGHWVRVPFDAAPVSQPPLDVLILDLDDALTELGAIDPRRSRIAELRFFAGLTIEESSEVLGVSPATIERDWQGARAWLYARLTKGTKRVDA
jgi:RNA polymerase sigma factor (TIGR02999 family)